MRSGYQTTLRSSAIVEGTGVHSNAPVQIQLHPADANTGIRFIRTGLENGRERSYNAHWSSVCATQLCTVLGEDFKNGISTVEHLMAACSALGLDNAIVEIDGPEVPIMDGSAIDFVDAIDTTGLVSLLVPRRYLKIRKAVRVSHGDSFAELRPAAKGFRFDVEIDFANPLIGRQRRIFDLDADGFRNKVARARTFGFVSEVKQLWAAGFAKGSALHNCIAIDGDRILNPEGLRFSDEFVRHKLLDAVGDLALSGQAMIGSYRSYKGGHRMNVAVLKALFADRDAYEFVELLPRRTSSKMHAGFAIAPAYAADRS